MPEADRVCVCVCVCVCGRGVISSVLRGDTVKQINLDS